MHVNPNYPYNPESRFKNQRKSILIRTFRRNTPKALRLKGTFRILPKGLGFSYKSSDIFQLGQNKDFRSNGRNREL